MKREVLPGCCAINEFCSKNLKRKIIQNIVLAGSDARIRAKSRAMCNVVVRIVTAQYFSMGSALSRAAKQDSCGEHRLLG